MAQKQIDWPWHYEDISLDKRLVLMVHSLGHQFKKDRIMTKNTNIKEVKDIAAKAKWYHYLFRLGVLALAAVLIFAGIQSLISAEPVIRYTFAAVITFFICKELV